MAVSQRLGAKLGTQTNDSATAGDVGEFISSNAASPGSSISNNTAVNVTSISLTPGDWDVWGVTGFIAAAGTTVALIATGINTTSATMPTSPAAGGVQQVQATLTVAGEQVLSAGRTRVSVAVVTTVYLVAYATFAVSTMTQYGYLAARRMR